MAESKRLLSLDVFRGLTMAAMVLLENPGTEIELDVENTVLKLPTGKIANFPIDAFAKFCLVEGIDQLGYLRQHTAAIEAFEKSRSWKP